MYAVYYVCGVLNDGRRTVPLNKNVLISFYCNCLLCLNKFSALHLYTVEIKISVILMRMYGLKYTVHVK